MAPPGPEHGVSPSVPGAVGWIFRSPARTFGFLFLLAFAIRAALFASWVNGRPNFWRPGGEQGKVAVSLLRSGQFADPYMIPTGPTAHPTPLWPALQALIYGSFGMTAAAGYVRALAAISSYALLFALLPWFARRLGLGTRAGIVAGVSGALIPQPWYEIVGHGFAAPAALALGFVIVAFVHRWTADRNSATGSLLLGLGCGAVFHELPPLLLVVLGCLIFELWWKRRRRTWLLAACVVAGAILACIPWTWRNYTALHGFCFIRSNLGLELRIANQDGASADMEETMVRKGTIRHPSENLEEARVVRDLGEMEYNRRARNEALEWISANRIEFLRLSFLRFVHFWCGSLRQPWQAALSTAVTVLALLGLRRILPALDAPGRAVLLIPLITFPLIYYVVSYVEHYPLPLAWLLLLLAGYEVRSWINRMRLRSGLTALPMGLLR